MASRKGSYAKRPLEWVFGYINTTDDTLTNQRIELGLRDDEVAEIWKLDSQIDIGNIPDAANDDVVAHMLLSMDPDFVTDPTLAATHEDLEVLFEHHLHIQQEVGAAGTAIQRNSDHKVSDFAPYPVLVGTDLGMCVQNDADIPVDTWLRVYFTRRKATVSELNQILLKRR